MIRLVSVVFAVIGYVAAVEPLIASGKHANEGGMSAVTGLPDREISYAELEEICAHYPWIVHCQGGAMEKRKSAYMRFGRSSPSEESDLFGNYEKRKSAYMRFGKRSSPESVDGELVAEYGPEMAKRKSAYMRFGKRKSAYMRFGKRSNDVNNDDVAAGMMEKRKSAYMRFGRR
jgi:hypothetical protein